MSKTTCRSGITTVATLVSILAGAILVGAGRSATLAKNPSSANSAITWVKFIATQRHVDLSRGGGGGAVWGGVTVQADEIVWFGSSTLSRRLIVYFLKPGSPDPGPQYNPANRTGALFLQPSEFSKWADLVYSGRVVYVRLDSDATHAHTVSTYNW